MPKSEISEGRVADLLDRILRIERQGYLLPLEGHEDELQRLYAHERSTAEELAAMDASSPAVLLAQLCYAFVEQGGDLFDGASAQRFDFAKVAADADTLQARLLARVVSGLEALAGGPVAEVVARYRALARQDAAFHSACYAALAPFEAAAAAAEGKRAGELQAAAERMREVMIENRRLAEQLAAVQAGAATELMAAE